jgi:hypothetical protein
MLIGRGERGERGKIGGAKVAIILLWWGRKICGFAEVFSI